MVKIEELSYDARVRQIQARLDSQTKPDRFSDFYEISILYCDGCSQEQPLREPDKSAKYLHKSKLL